MSPETWVKIIFVNGPFALLVFFFAVGETRARTLLRGVPVVKNKPLTYSIYAANWIAIFVMLGFAVFAWLRLNSNTEFTIKGRLENFQGSETVTSIGSELCLRHVYLPGEHFDYEWRLVTAKQVAEGVLRQDSIGLWNQQNIVLKSTPTLR